MNLKKTLFSIILAFSFNSLASDVKDTYAEVLGIVKLYCEPGQYFSPPKKTLIRSHLKSPIIGTCETDMESFFNIYIDMDFWNSSTKDIQFELMAHECLHCLFFENHSTDPKNFMYPVIRDLIKDQTYQQLIEYLNKKCN